jgi:PGF-CTERM protein
MSRMRSPLTAAVLVLAMFLSVLPPAEAGYKNYGDTVDAASTDKDVTHLLLVALAVAPGAEVMFDDSTPGGTVDSDEGVYIDSDGSGTVTPLDIRVRASSGTTGTKGELVKSSDTDCCGTALTAAPGTWGFVDDFPALVSGVCQASTGCPDGALNLGDPVFLDLDADGVVSTTDIKVTVKGSAGSGGVPTTGGSGSYTKVTASDVDIGLAITAIAGYALNVFDANANGILGTGDQAYLDIDGDQLVDPGDIRLNKGSSFAAGSMAKPGDTDTVHQLTSFGGTPDSFLAFDDSIAVDGVVGPTEGLYLDLDASTTVTIDDIRLIATGTTSGSAGKQVVTGDGDIGNALTAMPAGSGFKFRNLGGVAGLDHKDNLYVEVDGSATVEVGDFRVAKGEGQSVTIGARVTGSPSDLNAPLTAMPGTELLAFLDFNGGGGYQRNDVVYMDLDADGFVTARDVRLSIGPSPLGTFGDMITDEETEMEYCYATDLSTGSLGYVDASNIGVVDLDEGVYFDQPVGGVPGGTVSTNDVRMAGNTGNGAAGSFVAGGANDLNNPLTAIGTALSFNDANGDTVYSVAVGSTDSDTVYIDLDGSTTITVGDLRITKAATGSGTAGSRVTASAPASELNAALTAFVGAVYVGIDSNADGSFSSKDAFYSNVDAPTDTAVPGVPALGCVTPGDARLSGTGTSTSGGGGGGGGGGSTTSSPATIAISSPTAGACVITGAATTVSGTAGAGTTSGNANTISSVDVSADGGVLTVSGTSSWTAVFTPAADGTHSISATVNPSSGSSVSASRSITSAASCATGGTGGTSAIDQLIATLSTQLNETHANNQQLQEQLTQLNTQLGNQTQQLGNLQTQLAALQAENAKLKADLAKAGVKPTGTPGFEPLLALAALGAAMLALRRR